MCAIDWATTLGFFKVLFNWPPLLTLFLFWFARRFPKEISGLVDRIKGLKLPGGGELLLEGKELQQKLAQSTAPDLPGTIEESPSASGNVSATLPTQTKEADGESSVNFVHTQRAKFLYPEVDTNQVVQWMHKNPGPTFEDYIGKVFALHHERSFNLIFGTQVKLLAFLAEPQITAPSPAGILVPVYKRHVELAGNTERNLADFLGFLVSRTLLEDVGTPEGPLYAITPIGRDYLSYTQQYYPLQWDSKLF